MTWVSTQVNPPPGGPLPGNTAEDLYDAAGTVVLKVWPEWTRDGNKSVGWVWKLPVDYAQRGPLYGVNLGDGLDKETARQQGLAALQKLGHP